MRNAHGKGARGVDAPTVPTPGRWRRRAVVLTAGFALLATAAVSTGALLLAGRDDPAPGDARTPATIRVASFDFAEGELLGELFTLALEREGLPVEHVAGMGPREVVAPALTQGQVDVVPEYLAAALDFQTLGAGVPFTTAEATRRLAEELEDDGVQVLEPAPAVDRDAIAMHSERARELGVHAVADLAGHAHRLDFVGPAECLERPVCLPRLRDDHGIEFRSFTGVEPGLPVALALAAGEADVGLMFSTDPLVEDHDLVLLEDRRGRPEHVVPLVRRTVLERHGPAVARALARVTSALDTDQLVQMNRRVSHGEPTATVARDWLALHP